MKNYELRLVNKEPVIVQGNYLDDAIRRYQERYPEAQIMAARAANPNICPQCKRPNRSGYEIRQNHVCRSCADLNES
jgi:transposase-like protein